MKSLPPGAVFRAAGDRANEPERCGGGGCVGQHRGDQGIGLFRGHVGGVGARHRDEVVGAQFELRQPAVLGLRVGVEGLHLEVLVAPGDVALAGRQGPQVRRVDPLHLLDARLHRIGVVDLRLPRSSGERSDLGVVALARALDRELRRHLGLFHAHEDLGRGVGDDRLRLLLAQSEHRRDVLRREHQAEPERARLGRHHRHAFDRVVSDLVRDRRKIERESTPLFRNRLSAHHVYIERRGNPLTLFIENGSTAVTVATSCESMDVRLYERL